MKLDKFHKKAGTVQLKDIIQNRTGLEMLKEEKYLCGIISANGTLGKNISAGKNKEQGRVNEISALLMELC